MAAFIIDFLRQRCSPPLRSYQRFFGALAVTKTTKIVLLSCRTPTSMKNLQSHVGLHPTPCRLTNTGARRFMFSPIMSAGYFWSLGRTRFFTTSGGRTIILSFLKARAPLYFPASTDIFLDVVYGNIKGEDIVERSIPALPLLWSYKELSEFQPNEVGRKDWKLPIHDLCDSQHARINIRINDHQALVGESLSLSPSPSFVPRPSTSPGFFSPPYFTHLSTITEPIGKSVTVIPHGPLSPSPTNTDMKVE